VQNPDEIHQLLIFEIPVPLFFLENCEEINERVIEDFLVPAGQENSSAETEDTMGVWYQRRTQKGMGRTEKTVHTGAAKNPRLLKACNITCEKCDMCKFFFISIINDNGLNKFNHTKKNNFFNECQYLL
jgi:hypothetical protein